MTQISGSKPASPADSVQPGAGPGGQSVSSTIIVLVMIAVAAAALVDVGALVRIWPTYGAAAVSPAPAPAGVSRSWRAARPARPACAD